MADVALESIIAALQSADKEAEASNPWSGLEGASNGIGQLILKEAGSGKYGLGESVVGAGLAGLLGGTFTGLGDSYKAKQMGLAQDALFNSDLSEKPEGLNDSIFNSIKKSRSIFDIANKLEAAQDERKGNIDAKKTLLSALGQANTPTQQAQLLKYGQLLGLVPEGADLGDVGARNTPAKEPEVKGMFPGESLLSKRAQILQNNINMGLPGGAAQKETEDQLAAYKAANKENVDKVATARERAKNLTEIAGIAEQGMSGAGETGGMLNPLRELASRAYAVVNPEERQQRAAQANLDSVKPQMVALSRSPGATSDVEFKTYIGTSPSSANTPEENAAIIAKLNNVAKLEDDYAAFLEAYRTEKGTTLPTPGSPGAEALWKSYLKDNPAFVKRPDGSIDYNNARTDWRQYFYNGGIEQPNVGVAPSNSAAIPDGAIDTGRTSNGKPVYNVNGKLWVPD